MASLFLVSFLNGSPRKGENLLPVRANSFVLDLFSGGPLCTGEQTRYHRICLPCKNCVCVCVEGVRGWQLTIDIQ